MKPSGTNDFSFTLSTHAPLLGEERLRQVVKDLSYCIDKRNGVKKLLSSRLQNSFIQFHCLTVVVVVVTHYNTFFFPTL